MQAWKRPFDREKIASTTESRHAGLMATGRVFKHKAAYLRWVPLCKGASAPCWTNVFRGLFCLAKSTRCPESMSMPMVGWMDDIGVRLTREWCLRLQRILHEHFTVHAVVPRSEIRRRHGSKAAMIISTQKDRQTTTRETEQTSASERSDPRVWLIGLGCSLCSLWRSCATRKRTKPRAVYESTRTLRDLSLNYTIN